MLTVPNTSSLLRPITEDELDVFCALAEEPMRLRDSLARLFDKNVSKPDYCHAWIENGLMRAGVVYVNFPSTPGEFGMWRLFRLTEENAQTESAEILARSLRLVRQSGADRVEAQISSEQADVKERRNLLLACGMSIFQTKARYECTADTLDWTMQSPIELIRFTDIGKDSFIQLIGAATRDTLDRAQRSDYERLGEARWMDYYYHLLLMIDRNQVLWTVALVNGKPAGFVIPQMVAPQTGAINYIGVLPEYRGRGLSRELLKCGTANLLESGANSVIADIDMENHPMAASLPKVGYRKASELECYLHIFES
jgi:ribosomal protein S18 acetylase RimI-like enzyme